MAISSRGGTGVSAAVLIRGGALWKGAAGFSNPTDSTPIHPDMLFTICSIGKNYVAALTLQLVDEGEISLDDPIGKWVAGLNNVDRAITVRQLLSHTSGIFDYVKHPQSPYALPAALIEPTRIWSAEEILDNLVAEPYFAPGEGWKYSTTNYLILRLILEEVTGSTLSEMLEARILSRLDLRDTVPVDGAESIPDRFEIAHHWYDIDEDGQLDDLSEQSRNWYTIVPHLIYATAEDVARWSQALFFSEMLQKDTRDEMVAFYRPTPDEPFSGYGLGLGEFPPEMVSGETAWGHPGRDFGWTAVMVYFPRLEAHMAVLTNDNNMDCFFDVVKGLLNVIQANSDSK
jgi:D-alanyl-D-alanine carboxypeptidase